MRLLLLVTLSGLDVVAVFVRLMLVTISHLVAVLVQAVLLVTISDLFVVAVSVRLVPLVPFSQLVLGGWASFGPIEATPPPTLLTLVLAARLHELDGVSHYRASTPRVA